jgi:hypothetical protein
LSVSARTLRRRLEPLVRELSEALGLPAPELQVDPRATQTLSVHDVHKDGVSKTVFAVSAELAQPSPDATIPFVLARAIALTRPEWYVRFVIPAPGKLESVVRAALTLGGASPDAFKADPEVPVLARRLLPHLSPKDRDALEVITRRWLAEDRGTDTDTGDWWAAGELSSARAALAATGDLPAAAQVVKGDIRRGGLTPRDRLRDLLVFVVSEEFRIVRGSLGLGSGASPLSRSTVRPTLTSMAAAEPGPPATP